MQAVDEDGVHIKLHSKFVTVGVPQKSILGTICFINGLTCLMIRGKVMKLKFSLKSQNQNSWFKNIVRWTKEIIHKNVIL